MGDVCDRLSLESERKTMYMCELNELKEQLSTRDRTIIEVNNELECIRQQMAQLNNNYQTVLHQQQLAQHALYVA